MFYADQVGLKHIADRLSYYAKETNDPSLEPAPLLKRLAAEGKTFAHTPRPQGGLMGRSMRRSLFSLPLRGRVREVGKPQLPCSWYPTPAPSPQGGGEKAPRRSRQMQATHA